MLNLRQVVFIACAAVFAAVCVRLGVWQLHRLGERKRRNAELVARMDGAPVDVTALPRDTSEARFRRVRLNGRYDYAHEAVLAYRERNGAPGVDVITPLRMAGNDTAVLVDRGWVYSPDGATIDHAQWREPDSLSGTGRVQTLWAGPGPAVTGNRPDRLRWVSPEAVAAWAGYPVRPYDVMLEGDTAVSPGHPVRFGQPSVDEGPHMSYAIQWFSFALIAVIGAGLAVVRFK
ncbi:MAG TPA: SURF1 family protein [Gemmatimonadaceae bacterium]|nr:SURF1 family protein [Gemmatimonadaceae bacterium]